MSEPVSDSNMGALLDVKVNLSVELGSCLLPMKNISNFSKGTVVRLNQKIRDPVAVFANGQLIGYGEVIVVEESLGVKITELAME